MTNSPSLLCFSCLKQFHLQQQSLKYQKHQYPICNPNTDIITIQKHTLCHICINAFKNIRMTVEKYKIKAFNHQFKIDKIINFNGFMKFVDINMMDSKRISKNSINQMQTQQVKQYQKQHQYQQLYNIQSLPHGIYSMILLQTIQSVLFYFILFYLNIQNQYHYLHWLPKTLQYLIYLTNYHQRIRLQQRKQRIKTIISLISYSYSIQLKQIKYLSIIVHTLLCYMDENIMIKMLDKVMKVMVRNRLSLVVLFMDDRVSKSSVSEDKMLKKQKNVQYRPQKMLQCLLSVILLGDYFKDHKLQKYVKNIIQLSIKQLQQTKYNFIQQQQNLSNISQSKIFQTYITQTLKQSKQSKQYLLSQQEWQQLFQLKRQQNNYHLILKTIKKQQQQNQEIIKQMQNKYKKQKDEYINKIIRLNNKIEELENQLQQIKSKQNKYKYKYKQKDNQQQQKVTPQSCIDFKQFNQDEELTQQEEISMLNKSYNPKFKSQIKQQIKKSINDNNNIEKSNNIKNNNQECIECLKNILNQTQIMTFNLKYKQFKNDKSKNKSKYNNNKNNNNNDNTKSISPPTISLITQFPHSMQQLSQLLTKQIKSFKKSLIFFHSQNKKLKQQSSRLLNILKRKDQQWIPLLNQKDSMIAHYEDALILLEKGIIITEEPMKTRIEIILERVGSYQWIKQKMNINDDDEMSIRDSVLEGNSNNCYNQLNTNYNNQIDNNNNNINKINININNINNIQNQSAKSPTKQQKQQTKQQKKNSLKVPRQSKKSKSDKKADKKIIIQPNITSSSASKKKNKQHSSDCLIY